MLLDSDCFRHTLLPSKASKVGICTSLFLFSLGLTTTQAHADTLDKTTHSEENVTPSKNALLTAKVVPLAPKSAPTTPTQSATRSITSATNQSPQPARPHQGQAAPTTTPQATPAQPVVQPRTTTPTTMTNQDASIWMPDPVLREWVKQCLEHPKGNDAPLDDQITDANLWQHTGDVLNLSDLDHAILTPDPHRVPSYDNNWPADQDYDNPKHPQPDIHDTGTIMHPGTIHDLKGLEQFSNLQSFTISQLVQKDVSVASGNSNGDPIFSNEALTLTPQALLNYLDYLNTPNHKMGLSANLTHFELGSAESLNWNISASDIVNRLLWHSPKLFNLTLSGLGLTGEMPDVSGFSHLHQLILSHNRLTGTLDSLPALGTGPYNSFDSQAPKLYLNDNQFTAITASIPKNVNFTCDGNHLQTFIRSNDDAYIVTSDGQNIDLGTLTTSAQSPSIDLTQLIKDHFKGIQTVQSDTQNNDMAPTAPHDTQSSKAGQLTTPVAITLTPIQVPLLSDDSTPHFIFLHQGQDSFADSDFSIGTDDNGDGSYHAPYTDRDGDQQFKLGMDPKHPSILSTLTASKKTPSDFYWFTVAPAPSDGSFTETFTFTLDNQMNPRPVTPPTPVDPGNPDIPTPPTTPTVPVTPAPQPSDPTPVQPGQPAPSQPTPQPQTAGQGDHGTTTTKPGRPAGQGATITPQRPRPTTPRPQRSHPRTVAPRRTSRHATALTRSSRAPQSVAQLPQTNESTAHRLQLISLGLLTLTGALLWRKRS